MGVQLVTDDVPARSRLISRDHRLQVCQEIRLCRGRATAGGQQLSGDDVAAQDERASAMPHVFEFAPFDLTRGQGQSRMLALQSLRACQLVGTHRLLSLLS